MANESFTNAEQDIEILTGFKIPQSTQHRLVNNYQLSEPKITKKAKSLSVDGGTVRLRTSLGNKSEWKNYKAVKIHERVGTANLAEQALRGAVIWRRTSFGSQSQAGSEFVSRILTVVTSLKAQERNPLDYLTEACLTKRLGLSAPSLLPSTLSDAETVMVA